MSDEGLEEWDADFLDKLIQVEELAISSSTAALPQQQQQQSSPGISAERLSHDATIGFSYSPPRELSQRPKASHHLSYPNSNCNPFGSKTGAADDKLEISRLKGELGRVSKQLSDLQQECLQSRRERDKKEGWLGSLNLEAKNAEAGLNVNNKADIRTHPAISLQCQNMSYSSFRVCSQDDFGTRSCKIGESSHLTGNKHDKTEKAFCENLLSVWGSSGSQVIGRNLVSKFFAACSTELHALFGSMCVSMSAKVTDSGAVECPPGVTLLDHTDPAIGFDAAKASHLYFVLTKISNGMVEVEALIDSLLNLCHVKNVVIAHSSLWILHNVLVHLFSMEENNPSRPRDCLLVEELCSNTGSMNPNESEKMVMGNMFSAKRHRTLLSGYIPLQKNQYGDEFPTKPTYRIEWAAIFEVLCQIAVTSVHERVKVEAISTMTVILLRTNAYIEREKFGEAAVFKGVSQLLKKEAGSLVRKQAVHLLYLLLNCPKLFTDFCSGCQMEYESGVIANCEKQLVSGEFIAILNGLEDCVACLGDCIEDLKLCREAIAVIAFLASSGKLGFEIMLNHRLPRRSNFLLLILQLLISETDLEAADTSVSPEIFRERSLVIREALVFLNRLVSSPECSGSVLGVLAGGRDIACLTVDMANRLSRACPKIRQSDDSTWEMRQSEIGALAQAFRKRVFSYLGLSFHVTQWTCCQ